MEEVTQHIIKEKQECAFLRISVRAWIAILIVVTVCIMSLFDIKVVEPMYSISLLVIGVYFGQNGKQIGSK